MDLHHTTVTKILLASGAGTSTAAGLFAPLNFPLEDFGWATVFASIGIIGRMLLDARAARELARSSGGNPPSLDLVSMVYGIFSAPLIGGMALGFIRVTGFVPDGGGVFVIMGLGYAGRDGVNYLINLARDVLTRRTGNGQSNSGLGGPKA